MHEEKRKKVKKLRKKKNRKNRKIERQTKYTLFRHLSSNTKVQNKPSTSDILWDLLSKHLGT